MGTNVTSQEALARVAVDEKLVEATEVRPAVMVGYSK